MKIKVLSIIAIALSTILTSSCIVPNIFTEKNNGYAPEDVSGMCLRVENEYKLSFTSNDSVNSNESSTYVSNGNVITAKFARYRKTGDNTAEVSCTYDFIFTNLNGYAHTEYITFYLTFDSANSGSCRNDTGTFYNFTMN